MGNDESAGDYRTGTCTKEEDLDDGVYDCINFVVCCTYFLLSVTFITSHGPTKSSK